MNPEGKYDFTLKLFTQKAQFKQWLRIFFYLDNRLNSKSNPAVSSS